MMVGDSAISLYFHHNWDIAATGLVVLESTHTSGCPQGPDGSVFISSPLYKEVQGQLTWS